MTRRGIRALLALVGIGLVLVVLRQPMPAVLPVAVACLVTFSGLALALSQNNRSARMGERIEIGPDAVRIVRYGPATKARAIEFKTHWVKVDVGIDRRGDAQVVLAESGRRAAIGAFLPPAEREDLAEAIRSSIREVRQGRGLSS